MYAKRQNDTDAFKWFHRAAVQGYAEAQYYLGVTYANGHGVIQNYADAFKWFRKAAEQGHADAQYILEAMKNAPRVDKNDTEDGEAAKK